MANTITLTASDGSTVEFIDEIRAQGGVKDVYFSPDRSYVVAFYRHPLSGNDRERIENIVGVYRERIFTPGQEGDYWRRLFAWPTAMVEWQGKTGVVMPFYDKCFFFSGGSFNGKEKNGKWFSSAKLRNRFLTPDVKGTFLDMLHVCLKLARAVRRLHAAGLAHSDLSYNNILIDPPTGSVCIIDDDSLVVPGKFPPEVLGTPDFIAPEVMTTRHLPIDDPRRSLPSIYTDRHALAVLIYMYLLNRHPLRGGKVHDTDDAGRDEELAMGREALFIEHPSDTSNRVQPHQLSSSELPQGDPARLPYDICGPYLKELFDRAFIEGLHNPARRPTAAEWETALVKTADLMQPCPNSQCSARWYVFDNTKKPHCPFCGHDYFGPLPILNFYYSPSKGKFLSEKYRLMVYNKQTLYPWHTNRYIVPNEKTTPDERRPVGDFHLHNGQWILINRRLPSLWDKTEDRQIPIGGYIPLTEGRKILFSTDEGSRLAVVQVTN